MFQFPTGWNSTIFNINITLNIWIVSIPNGMEFYNLKLLSYLILYYVSIPNGMEFYSDIDLQNRIISGFNSQRDGILLLRRSFDEMIFKRFQFPTGWNSTLLPRLRKLFLKKFQFPTGWNSTARILPFF